MGRVSGLYHKGSGIEKNVSVYDQSYLSAKVYCCDYTAQRQSNKARNAPNRRSISRGKVYGCRMAVNGALCHYVNQRTVRGDHEQSTRFTIRQRQCRLLLPARPLSALVSRRHIQGRVRYGGTHDSRSNRRILRRF